MNKHAPKQGQKAPDDRQLRFKRLFFPFNKYLLSTYYGSHCILDAQGIKTVPTLNSPYNESWGALITVKVTINIKIYKKILSM